MSSHHSQKFFSLHHYQVNNGRARQLQRQAERLQCFLTGRAEARAEYNCVLVLSFIWFSYMNIGTAVYLGYIVSLWA